MFRDLSHRIRDATPFKGYGVAVTPGREGPLALVCGYGDANRLYSWSDECLADSACGIVADASRHAVGVAAADFDADGIEEIYVHNTDTHEGVTADTDLLLNRRAVNRLVWTDTFTREVNANRGNDKAGRSVATLDRLGTGRYGALVATCDGRMPFYEFGDDGEVTDMAGTLGLGLECCGRSVLTGPLVSDRMDVLVGVEGGSNRLYRNSGGHFAEVALGSGLADRRGDARGLALVDVAGQSQIAVTNWEHDNHLFASGTTVRFDTRGDSAANGYDVTTNDGVRVVTESASVRPVNRQGQSPGRPRNVPGSRETPFIETTPAPFAQASRARTLIAADFDNDGRQELFVNALGDVNRLFRWSLSGWERVAAGDAREPDGLGTGAAVADFDGDGILELLIVHGEVEPQPLSLYSIPNSGDWLRIRPLTQHGAPARGAVVKLETDVGNQVRTIDAGGSYLCQSEPVAHFGLGTASPQRVTVQWPDGQTRIIGEISSRQERRVTHPIAPANS